MYAILSHGGRQYRVSAGDRLLVDRLVAEVGSVVALEPLLLTGGDGEKTAHGKDLDGMRVAATVVAHRRGKKLRIFKYKAKKRSRKVAGYRSDLTELRVDSILAKGAALPAASAGNGAAPSRAGGDAGEPADRQPAARERKAATATAAKPGRAAPKAGATTPKAAAKPKPTGRASKTAPKATRPGKAAADAHDKESDDGA
jgi:large subunit ribosomal protein L21